MAKNEKKSELSLKYREYIKLRKGSRIGASNDRWNRLKNVL